MAVLAAFAACTSCTTTSPPPDKAAATQGATSNHASPSTAPSPDPPELTCRDLLASDASAQLRMIGFTYLRLTFDEPTSPAEDPVVLDRAFTYVIARCVLDEKESVSASLDSVILRGRTEGVLP